MSSCANCGEVVAFHRFVCWSVSAALADNVSSRQQPQKYNATKTEENSDSSKHEHMPYVRMSGKFNSTCPAMSADAEKYLVLL